MSAWWLAASRAHRAFRLTLVGLAGSRQLTLAYEPVILKLQLHMAANRRREADERSPAPGVVRHRRLPEAIAAGDPARARYELPRHGSRALFH